MPHRPHPFVQLKRGLQYVMGVLGETYEAWRDDRAIRLGAGLAYYGLLALVPLVVLAVVIASLVFSDQEIQTYINDALDAAISSDIDELTDELSEHVQANSARSSLGVIGTISLVIAASFLFMALEDALKVIWREPVRPGFKNSLKRRALAALVALLACSLLLASLIVTTLLGVAERLTPGDQVLLDAATHAAVTAALWALGIGFLAVLTQILVRRRISWLALLIGGTVTAITLNIGTGLVWTYLQTSSGRSAAGLAGGIILVLIWMYYVAQMFIAGSVLTRVLDMRMGSDPT
jgi:membrane protein